jgi:hypothetical protein
MLLRDTLISDGKPYLTVSALITRLNVMLAVSSLGVS